MINPTKAFLLFVIATGLFGIFLGLNDRRSGESIVVHKSFLRGCFSLASGLIVLALFVGNIFGPWAAIASIGILLLLQEYTIAGIARFHAQKLSPQDLRADTRLTEAKREETWDQIRKKGRARLVVINTTLYGLAGVVLVCMGVLFAPDQLPAYMSITIILAAAVGGATVAIRQWNWHERNERLNGAKANSQRQTDEEVQQ